MQESCISSFIINIIQNSSWCSGFGGHILAQAQKKKELR